jgi:hypothetical protein
VSSLVYFFSVLQIFIIEDFTFLIRVTPQYFIFLEVLVNVISFSMASLLVYKIATDFCILTSYPYTLLNLFTRAKCLLMWSLKSSKLGSCHLKRGIIWFLPSHLGWFYFFLLLSALIKISSIILNNSTENEHPCLVPEFRAITSNFSPFTLMLV